MNSNTTFSDNHQNDLYSCEQSDYEIQNLLESSGLSSSELIPNNVIASIPKNYFYDFRTYQIHALNKWFIFLLMFQ